MALLYLEGGQSIAERPVPGTTTVGSHRSSCSPAGPPQPNDERKGRFSLLREEPLPMSDVGFNDASGFTCCLNKAIDMQKISKTEDPAHWRHRAEEACRVAEQLDDPLAKRAMLDIARSYEQLAALADAKQPFEIAS